jgi:hypothetical protein
LEIEVPVTYTARSKSNLCWTLVRVHVAFALRAESRLHNAGNQLPTYDLITFAAEAATIRKDEPGAVCPFLEYHLGYAPNFAIYCFELSFVHVWPL